jgi:hypothetical protein
MLAPVVESREPHGSQGDRDQLQLGDEANSIIAGGGDLGTCRPQVTSVGDLPTSSVSAVQLVPGTMGSEQTHPAPRGPRDPLLEALSTLQFTVVCVRLYAPPARAAGVASPSGRKCFRAHRPGFVTAHATHYDSTQRASHIFGHTQSFCSECGARPSTRREITPPPNT